MHHLTSDLIPLAYLRTVLILVYYWPPSAGSGVQRWLKMAKYLPEHGWRPVIITPQSGTAPYYDDTLLADVPPEAEVIHTSTLEPFALYNLVQGKKRRATVPVGMMGIKGSASPIQRLSAWVRGNLFIPDARAGWAPFAARAALKRIAEGGVDLIVSTGPPHSTHLAARKVAKQTGLPWVADLRDPWTNIYYNQDLPRSAWARKKDKKLEDAVLADATAVTVVSPGMEEEFGGRAKKLRVIYNGFDEADLPRVRPAPHSGFVLSHVGNFFPSLDAPGLWAAIGELQAELPGFADDFVLRFVGMADHGVVLRLAQASSRKGFVQLAGPVGHKAAVAEMMQATILLFALSKEGNTRLLISGKLFEYLATGLPILAIGDAQSGAATILKEDRGQAMHAHADKAAIKADLAARYLAWKAGHLAQPVAAKASPYSRRALAGEMAQLFEQVTQKSGTGL